MNASQPATPFHRMLFPSLELFPVQSLSFCPSESGHFNSFFWPQFKIATRIATPWRHSRNLTEATKAFEIYCFWNGVLFYSILMERNQFRSCNPSVPVPACLSPILNYIQRAGGNFPGQRMDLVAAIRFLGANSVQRFEYIIDRPPRISPDMDKDGTPV